MDKILLLDESRGIYIPMKFAENFEGWRGITEYQKTTLLEGPENQHYWEVWEEVLANASWADDSRMVWTLEQDGDLFAVPENYHNKENNDD